MFFAKEKYQDSMEGTKRRFLNLVIKYFCLMAK